MTFFSRDNIAVYLLMKFRAFTEAREFVRVLALKNVKEWESYCKSGKKPADIPVNPDRVYDEWKDYGDWLGTGTVATQDRQYRPFEQARDYARSLGLKNMKEWVQYCKSGNKSDNIPASPHVLYEKDWKNYPDWVTKKEIGL